MSGKAASQLLITGARIVERAASLIRPVDLRVSDGRITAVGSLRPEAGEEVLDAAGRWATPGLWDRHAHFDQWVISRQRLDLTATGSAAEVIRLVGQRAAQLPADRLLVGYGHRRSHWPDQAVLADLDAVTGARPTALVAADAHNGWINSAAARLLQIEPPPTLLTEHDWFPVMARITDLERADAGFEDACDSALTELLARGVTGITDMEFEHAWLIWQRRAARGAVPIRIQTAVYPDFLDEIVELGWASGHQIADLVTMGPLKIITDGSLGTLTAHCCQPYLLPDPAEPIVGVQTVAAEALQELLAVAARQQLSAAVHAIGDAAGLIAIDAAEGSGAQTSIEHAQLMGPDAIARMARLGVQASVQPAHLPDDVAMMDRIWADRTDRAFPLRSMLDAGVEVFLGSDAPVSALDPWLQMDVAVRRPTGWGPDAASWHPEQAITPGEALFCSTNGQPPLGVGSVADIVLTDADPHTAALAEMVCATTIVAGSIRYDAR